MLGGWLTFWKPGSYQPMSQELKVPIRIRWNGHSRFRSGSTGRKLVHSRSTLAMEGLCAVQHAKTCSSARSQERQRAGNLLRTRSWSMEPARRGAYVTHADLTVGVGAQSVTWKSAARRSVELGRPSRVERRRIWQHRVFVAQALPASRLTTGTRSSICFKGNRSAPSSLSGDYGLEMRPSKGRLRRFATTGRRKYTRFVGRAQVRRRVWWTLDGIPALLLKQSVTATAVESHPGRRSHRQLSPRQEARHGATDRNFRSPDLALAGPRSGSDLADSRSPSYRARRRVAAAAAEGSGDVLGEGAGLPDVLRRRPDEFAVAHRRAIVAPAGSRARRIAERRVGPRNPSSGPTPLGRDPGSDRRPSIRSPSGRRRSGGGLRRRA